MTLNTYLAKVKTKIADILYNVKSQIFNQNKDFSIISSNCIGTSIYQSLNVKYKSPTIGLFFYAPCYIKFIYNLEHYLTQTLSFEKQSKYEQTKKISYPIGKLGDIEIHFMHYKNEEEAQLKWNERAKRINFNNLFFLFSDRDGCSYNEIKLFDDFKKDKKICFVSKNYPELKSTVWVKKYANEPCIGDLYTNKLYRKYLNIVDWLNTPKEE